MATFENLQELVCSGALVRIVLPIRVCSAPSRYLYATPRAHKYIVETLPQLPQTQMSEATPHEQVYSLFKRFVCGNELSYGDGNDIRDINPSDLGVWELKTEDMRLFGWFPLYDVFICDAVDDASRIKEFNLYAGYRDQCVAVRDQMALSEPKFVDGELKDVISF